MKMTTHTANETNLDIELNDFLGSPITIKCEVEILKDNGYGRLSTDTETEEVFFISPLHSTPIAHGYVYYKNLRVLTYLCTYNKLFNSRNLLP